MKFRCGQKVFQALILLTAVAVSSHAAPGDAYDIWGNPTGLPAYDESIKTTQQELEAFEKEKTELQTAVDRCFPNGTKESKTCRDGSGRWAKIMRKENYDKMTARIKELEEKTMGIRFKMFSDFRRADNTSLDANKKLVQERYLRKADVLVMSSRIAANELKTVGLEMKQVYQEWDKSMLGDYSRYVAREYAKSKEMAAQVCKAVTTCDAIKGFKGTLDQMGTRLDTVPEFKARQGGGAAPTQTQPVQDVGPAGSRNI